MTTRRDDIVIVVDQAQELGGSERVLKTVMDLYPDVPVLAAEFTTTNLPRECSLPWKGGRIGSLGVNGRRRHFLSPIYARRVAGRRIQPAAVVISISHSGWAMAADVPPGARHVSYNAGPPRWLYTHTREYLKDYPAITRPSLYGAVPFLRRHHRQLIHRPHRLVTNSRWSANEIRRLFARSADPIYPPVMTHFFTPAPRERRHVLVVGRLVPHKRAELAIEAFRGLPQHLVVVGGGAWFERLQARAPSNVTFTGYVDDKQLRELYRSSIALISPCVEEFGIAMAEAQSAGTAVIAPRAGGAMEIVRDGVSGILLDQVDIQSIAQAVRTAASRDFDPATCRATVARFGEDRFRAAFQRVVDQELKLARLHRRPCRPPMQSPELARL